MAKLNKYKFVLNKSVERPGFCRTYYRYTNAEGKRRRLTRQTPYDPKRDDYEWCTTDKKGGEPDMPICVEKMERLFIIGE